MRALPPSPAGVPPARASCALAPSEPSACPADTPEKQLELLSAALGAKGGSRDSELEKLEACSALEPGLVRALRAELAPSGCADALVEPYLASAPAELRADVRETLIGLALGGRLARLAFEPPVLPEPYDKDTFQRFMKTTLLPWTPLQATAIQRVAEAGAKLSGYAKGVVAVEAGMADMRFVGIARGVPLPEEMAKDAEVREVYYSSLDQALEMRKQRGRDGALVGLRKLAEAGVLNDPRLDRARELLSKLYAGRRIDSLDGLALPPLGAAEPKTADERLATQLPAFYAGIVLAKRDATDPALLRALLERGLPASFGAKLAATSLEGDTARLYARALVAFGQRYWRVGDFARAARAAASAGAAHADEAQLIAALAKALEGGPQDAASMMLRGPMLPDRVGEISALDDVARGKGKLAGLAEYDAAYLRALVPRTGRDAKFWKEVAARFRRAAKKVANADLRKDALDRAKDAAETAKAATPP